MTSNRPQFSPIPAYPADDSKFLTMSYTGYTDGPQNPAGLQHFTWTQSQEGAASAYPPSDMMPLANVSVWPHGGSQRVSDDSLKRQLTDIGASLKLAPDIRDWRESSL